MACSEQKITNNRILFTEKIILGDENDSYPMRSCDKGTEGTNGDTERITRDNRRDGTSLIGATVPTGDDAMDGNDDEEEEEEEEKSDDEEAGEGVAEWDLITVIAEKDLGKKKPKKCQDEGCLSTACSVWVSNLEPDEEWYGCIDCMEK